MHNKATSDDSAQSTPYKFTGKELDEETGLYYYGARYYDGKFSRWISADPPLARGDYLPVPAISDEAKEHNSKLPGMGGVFNSINIDAYQYAGQNPVKMVDPDGNANVLGAIGGAVGGAALEVFTQATANMIADKDAFEDLDYSDIAVSTLLGAGAGASGLGGIKLTKETYSAYKKYKTVKTSLKAREVAIAAGKVRNAEKTAKVANKVKESKKTIIKSVAKGGSVAAAKKIVQTTDNKIQNEKNDKKSEIKQ